MTTYRTNIKKLTVVTLTTLGFLWLAQYSQQQGYTWHERQAFNRLHDSVVTKEPLVKRQAAAYAYLYNITPEQAARPVDLFGEGL